MMLFDLESDRGEQKNAAAEYSQIVEYLHAQFERMRAQVPRFAQPQSD